MKAPVQLDLLSLARRVGSEPAIDRTFRGARRHVLDAHSWVDHVPGWLTRDDLLFADLGRLPGWEQRQRWMYTDRVEEPRLTAEFGSLDGIPVPFVRAIAEVLSARYGVPYDSTWMNLYRDHRDSTGWHFDKPPARREEAIVPVLSMGETRRFLIRRAEGGPSTVFHCGGGDLVVMGGRCQREWVHCVPKETRPAGPRISVNFGSAWQSTSSAT